MTDELLLVPPAIRLAVPDDIDTIEALDAYSTSPTRDMHRDMEQYFGSVDPSTHNQTLIFLAEINGVVAAKAELMLPPPESIFAIGYIKRVIVHPHFRKRGLSRTLMQHIITLARDELSLVALDLHVWENNFPAIHLYTELGFELQHRELYFRLPLAEAAKMSPLDSSLEDG